MQDLERASLSPEINEDRQPPIPQRSPGSLRLDLAGASNCGVWIDILSRDYRTATRRAFMFRSDLQERPETPKHG